MEAQNGRLHAMKTAGNACLKDRQFWRHLQRFFNELEDLVFGARLALLWSLEFVAARGRAAQGRAEAVLN